MIEDIGIESFDGDPGHSVESRLQSEALCVDLDGYEGPLDLLLMLSRTQKVDVRKISILQLAEQYLGFIETANNLRIELAADYLVMAAWMAYLKSRLLLPPDPDDDGPSGAELAAHLAFQLERLEAMRRAAARLMARDRKGRDFFARGLPESVSRARKIKYGATLLDLMQAYALVKTRDDFVPLSLKRGPVFTMEQAMARLATLVGTAVEWGDLIQFLPEGWGGERAHLRSATASTFAAALEMVRMGRMEVRQNGNFAPIQLRGKT